MKKKNIFFAYLITIVLTIGMLVLATNITENKMSDYKFNNFFEEDNNYDVLFFGSSHIVNGVFPMELWNEFKIKSYNMAGHGTQIPTTYWVLKNSLDYYKPKVVVIDGYLLSHNYKTSEKYKYLHYSFDAFPLSINKIKAIIDLNDDPIIKDMMEKGSIIQEARTKLEIIWNYSIYHSRWNELTQEDFANPSSPEKGAEHNIGIYKYDGKYNNTNSMLETDTVGMTYVQKMLNLCKENGIDVILTYLPMSAGEENCYKENNTLCDIAKKNSVDFISFIDNDILDHGTDFADDASHLNPSGAKKITSYIGKYIKNKYKIEHEKNNNYLSWEKDYEKYVEYKKSLLLKQDNLDYYLMLSYDNCFCTIIEVKNSVANEKLKHFLGVNSNNSITCGTYVVNNEDVSYYPNIEELYEKYQSLQNLNSNGTINIYSLYKNEIFSSKAFK